MIATYTFISTCCLPSLGQATLKAATDSSDLQDGSSSFCAMHAILQHARYIMLGISVAIQWSPGPCIMAVSSCYVLSVALNCPFHNEVSGSE